MALLAAAGTEDELEYSNQTTEDEEYVCLSSHGITELEEVGEEEEEEEYICLPSYGSTEEEEEMDEEEQVLCEGSLSPVRKKDSCSIFRFFQLMFDHCQMCFRVE